MFEIAAIFFYLGLAHYFEQNKTIMKKLALLMMLITMLFIGLVGCSDNDENKGVPIERIEASTEIDLSKYQGHNLQCYVNGKMYDYVIEGNTVAATPKPDGEIAYSYLYEEGMIGGSVGVYMNLGESSFIWNPKQDQNTFEKMMSYDFLSCGTGEYQKSVIKGLTLGHQFSMLSFATKNLPDNAVVTVSSDRGGEYRIKPYKTSNNIYRCIPYLAMQMTVMVSIDGKDYYTPTVYDAVKQKTRAVLQDSDVFYTFEVVYNADAEKDENKLSIENGKVERWINQHFE